MRKGMKLYDDSKSPIYFEPTQDLYIPPEEFRMIESNAVPGIRPYYMISNYGRIWHIYRREFLTMNMDSKGYLFKPLATDHGAVNCRIHRLVMMTFCYFDGCESVLVNHIDGIKTNCCITNLEWVNYSENMIHAFNRGLVGKSPKITEEIVRQICEYLQEGTKTLSEISEITGIAYQTVSAIQNKRSHIDISEQYDIKPRKISNNFTIEQVRNLCSYYENNKKDPKETLDQYCLKAVNTIGIKDPGYKIIRTAKKILSRETYGYISCEYNF